MKVHVIFDFPEVSDVNSEEADDIIDCLNIDLKNFGNYYGYEWYIDDAEGEVKNG